MPNVTTQEAYERREKIWKDWLKGRRSVFDLAKRHECDYFTVKRDLVLLRQGLRRRIKDETFELILREEDSALLEDIAQIEELIDEIRKSQPEKSKVIAKDGKIIEGSTEKEPINYGIIVSLIDRKMRLRRQREELWGFVSSTKGMNISVQAQANAEAKSYALSGVSESDLRKIIELAEFVNKFNSENGSGSTNRISSAQG